MESYDDRPASMYDNLNMPTTSHMNAPKAKATSIATATTSNSATTSNGATSPSTPYSDISFKFNDNNKPQQQQLKTLPNGNRSLSPSQLQTTTTTTMSNSQVHPNNALYATPFKPTTTKMPTPTAGNAITATSASTVQRPLSQHSQSELYEASQSIAAVKAALNDAKSKFFGLNGYVQDNNATLSIAANEPLLQPPHASEAAVTHRPKVQIVTPPKPQPKYQNIPENSAIFRNTPPALPPKPSAYQRASTADVGDSTAAPTATGSSPTHQHSEQLSRTPEADMPLTAAPNSARILPFTTYKQIPLNDTFDITQPSQAVYMSTTVPQNIKGSKIAGRHTPTRNSLRHSRMLVVNNKTYQGMSQRNPMNFKQPNLPLWLLIFEIIFGILLCFLAIWIFYLAPSTAIQDNPYWSGLTLILAGILGLVLIRYPRIKRDKVRENCFVFLHANSYFLALLALVLCSVALICASIHFLRLTAANTKCESTNMLLEHGSCSCTFNAVTAAVHNAVTDALYDDADTDDDVIDQSYKVEYRDLSCSEVSGEWTYILAFSITLNAVGFMLSLLYILLLTFGRHNSKRIYASVHTSTF